MAGQFVKEGTILVENQIKAKRVKAYAQIQVLSGAHWEKFMESLGYQDCRY